MLDMADQWRILDEEVSATQMPEEYRDVTVWILCRDCHKVVCMRRVRTHECVHSVQQKKPPPPLHNLQYLQNSVMFVYETFRDY